MYPYEVVPALTREGGTFTEYDLDDDGRLVPVDRPFGGHSAGVVVGVVRTITDRYPDGMVRVAIFGDPTKALGAIAEPECVRIIAALDLAERAGRAGRVARGVGRSEDLDGQRHGAHGLDLARAPAPDHLHPGRGEVNVLVAGINVGAQPYFNAEATMLLHTRGILVMTPDSAMVLTGKQALDYSGGVSAEDNFGIGGYDRIMGPNGQAPVLGPRPGGRLRDPASPTTSTPTSRPASASRGARRAPIRSTATSAAIPTTPRTASSRPSATSSRWRRTPSARSPSTSAP